MDDLIQYINKKHRIPQEKAEAITGLFKPHNYAKDTVLLAAGEVWQEVFYIKQGLLRLFYTTREGKEYNKGFFAEGQLVWPMAPSARTESSLFSITCLESSRLYCCSFDMLQKSLITMSAWEEFALPYVENLANQKFLREYQFLVSRAEARYQQILTELGPLATRIPDYHIASYLGITNVTLSRIKTQIKVDANS